MRSTAHLTASTTGYPHGAPLSVGAPDAHAQYHWLRRNPDVVALDWDRYRRLQHSNARLRAWIADRVTFVDAKGKSVLVSRTAVELLRANREFYAELRVAYFDGPTVLDQAA